MQSLLTVVLVIAFLYASLALFDLHKRRKYIKDRKDITYDDFYSYFIEKSVSERDIKVIHDYFSRWMNGNDKFFPVLAEDEISKVYGIEGEDLFDAVQDVLNQTDRKSLSEVQVTKALEIKTIQDFIDFIVSIDE